MLKTKKNIFFHFAISSACHLPADWFKTDFKTKANLTTGLNQFSDKKRLINQSVKLYLLN